MCPTPPPALPFRPWTIRPPLILTEVGPSVRLRRGGEIHGDRGVAMTEQPGGHNVPTVSTEPSEAQMQAFLLAALEALAGGKVLAWHKAALADVDQQLAAIPAGPRRALWTQQLNALIAHLLAQLHADLPPTFGAGMQEILEDLEGVEHGFTVAEVDPIALTPALVKRASQYVGSSSCMKNITDTVLPAKTQELAVFATRPQRLEPYLVEQLAAWKQEFDELSMMVADVDLIEADITGMKLTAFLAPLTEQLYALRDKARLALQTTPAQTAALIDQQLLATFTATEEHQKQLIKDLCGNPKADAQVCTLNLSGELIRTPPSLISCFAPLTTMGGPAIKTCTSLAQSYGKPFVVCFGTQEPEAMVRVVSHCQNKSIFQAVTKRLGQHPPLAMVSKVVGILAWDNPEWDQVCLAINKFAYTEIDLPPNSNAIIWQPLGNLWVPVGMEGTGFRTDKACIKHHKQELGPNPTKAKAEAYYAELVEACRRACHYWASNGRPASIAAPDMPLTVGTWRIRVKNLYGQAEVFHIDSYYQNSAWINHKV
jgi:hypothetical protein